MKTNSLHLDNLTKAIDAISSAFHWGSSDEGHGYWQSVVEKLEGYRSLARKGDSCRQEIAELKKRIAELELRC